MAISIAENKVKYLVAVAASIVIVCQLFGYSIGNSISYTITFMSLSVYAFDQWLWRVLPEKLSGVPKLYGTWQGSLKGKWVNLDTKAESKKNVNPMFFSVEQTFFSTKIFGYPKESNSASMCVSMRKRDNGNWMLSYVYDNEPDLVVRKKSQRHRGASELQISTVGGTRRITGEYWTDRWSQGEVLFEKREKKFATSYADACDIFKIAP